MAGYARSIAALVLLLVLVTACGAEEQTVTVSSSSTTAATAPPTLGAAPSTAVAAPTPAGEVRLGCGTYCQTAGGYGAPPGEPAVFAVSIASSSPVAVGSDGFAPVTITCNLPVRCDGAFMLCLDVDELGSGEMQCARADQAIDPHATRTFGVPLTTPMLSWLHTNGTAPGWVVSDNGGVPKCAEIPELAAKCASLPLGPGGNRHEGIDRIVVADLTLTPPPGGWGSHAAAEESASLSELQQLAASDEPFVADQLADRWVPQLSSKTPSTVDDGFAWDNTLTLQEHERLRHRYSARLVWSSDWSSFSVPDVWVTVAPMTFPDSAGALQWCKNQGWDGNHCAAKLISQTHPPDGSFAHY